MFSDLLICLTYTVPLPYPTLPCHSAIARLHTVEKIIKAIPSRVFQHRAAIPDQLALAWRACHAEAISRLRGAPLAAIVDESTTSWPTLSDQPRLVAVVLQNLTTNFSACIDIIPETTASGDTVREIIRKSIMDNDLGISSLMAVISDNAAYMVKCVRDLNKKHDFAALHVRCSAHMLNLLVEKWLHSTVHMSVLYQLAAFIRTGKKQDVDHITAVVNSDMMKGTATRWTYYLDAIAALLTRTMPPKPYDQVFRDPPVRVELLRQIVSSKLPASPLDDALSMPFVQERFAFAQHELGTARALFTRLQSRVGDSLQDVMDLQVLLRKWRRPAHDMDGLKTAANLMLRQYQRSRELFITEEFVSSMQPRVAHALGKMSLSIEHNWILMDEFLALKTLLNPSTRNLAVGTFPKLAQGFLNLPEGAPHAASWNAWLLARGDVLALSTQLASYVSSAWTCDTDQPAAMYWQSRMAIWPDLARMALAVVQLPLSSAEVERVFSTVTLMEIEKIRSSLGGENFLTELKLRANPGLLDDVCSGLAAALDSSSGSKRSREE